MLNGKTVPKPWPAAAIKDRSPMVTFVKRFGVLRRMPLLFRRKSWRDGGKTEIK